MDLTGGLFHLGKCANETPRPSPTWLDPSVHRATASSFKRQPSDGGKLANTVHFRTKTRSRHAKKLNSHPLSLRSFTPKVRRLYSLVGRAIVEASLSVGGIFRHPMVARNCHVYIHHWQQAEVSDGQADHVRQRWSSCRRWHTKDPRPTGSPSKIPTHGARTPNPIQQCPCHHTRPTGLPSKI